MCDFSIIGRCIYFNIIGCTLYNGRYGVREKAESHENNDRSDYEIVRSRIKYLR